MGQNESSSSAEKKPKPAADKSGGTGSKNSKANAECDVSLKCIFFWVNIIVGIILIIYGVLQYWHHTFSWMPWYLVQPAFLTIFGIIMICSENNVKTVVEYLPFLKYKLGIGIYDIYLAGVITQDFDSKGGWKTVGYITSIALCLIGVIYILFFFLFERKKQNEGDDKTEDSENGTKNKKVKDILKDQAKNGDKEDKEDDLSKYKKNGSINLEGNKQKNYAQSSSQSGSSIESAPQNKIKDYYF